ncbi:uncharacterized protein LOC107492642 [Arachis duranensis]|uniref:Uncharacterized protein LOC107492642 n=1 Tax=Arachis duranensis TaxID=130453 RepID=A0A6P5MAH9_ARADU|nr:uncharacterized protein LOC107492642 [Arachis duranensis]
MSPAVVHLRSPITSSAFQTTDSVPDSTSHSSFHHHTPFPHFNAEALNPSSATATAAPAGGASMSRGRTRARLVKQRKKQSASQHVKPRDATPGFDSVPSDQVTGNISDLNGFSVGSVGLESGVRACDGGSSNCYRKLGGDSFVFGATSVSSGSARDLGSEQGRESSVGSVHGREGAPDRETEVGKSDPVEFVFSATRSNRESNLGRKTGESAAGVGFGDERKRGLNSELRDWSVNAKGFVFCADQNGFVDNSNAQNEKSGESVENSVFGDAGDREGRDGAECAGQDSFRFVFGSCNGEASSFKVENQGNLDGTRNFDPGMGNFNYTKAATDGNSNVDDNKKHGYGSSNDISTAYGATPAYKLTDEMEKLNIDHSKEADVTRDSTNSHVNDSTGFVFGGRENVYDYFSTGSGTNANGHKSCSSAASGNIGGQYFKACKPNDVQDRTGCGIACGFTRVPCTPKPPKDSEVNGATSSFSSSAVGLDSISNNYTSAGHPLSGNHDKCDNYFTSIPEALKESFMGFKPPMWDPSAFKDNLFPKLDKKLESTQKVRSSKEKGSKHMRRKLKPHSLNKKQTRLDPSYKENSSLETPDSSGCHSPMDFSPYQEMAAEDQDVKDENLAGVGRGTDINRTDQRCGGSDNEQFSSHFGSFPVGDFHSSGPEVVWPTLKTQQFSSNAFDSGVDYSSINERQKDDLFCSVHDLGDSKEKDFAFSASSTVAGTSSPLKRKQKKKFRSKIGCNSFVISPKPNGKFGSSVQFSPLTTSNMPSHFNGMDRSQVNHLFKEGDFASSVTIHEACEKWRLRGNKSYKDGDLSKAEEFYTLGINSVPTSESGCQIKPLLLCYSNRAATRMSLGRIREALGDCKMASALDPTFLKVQMRTANCHLLLGEIENAMQCFSKCMDSGNAICLDRRVVVEAAEGLQKAQKVVECSNNAAKHLKERTSDAAETALELLTKALSISSYSERLLSLKAEALFSLQRYGEAIQLCEQSRCLAEKNFDMANSTDNLNISTSDSYASVKLWRSSLISKCYFHLGRLETSLNILEKLQQVGSVNDKCVIHEIRELLSLAATIRELLDQKRAGNENFKLGKYTEAVEHYTSAISSNIKSRPFVAICFGNRAAAYQALGQIADAIADCSMAIALDTNYVKAISRRATLHEMVRDYEHAACDLRKLISVLESQSNQKANQSDSPSGSPAVKELRQAHQRLSSVEDQAKRGLPLDFYLILGTKPADTANDIKKAYHKAALKHHPDKAGQLLARSEIGDEGQAWKEILQEVHKDADRLFKMIGEAYTVLSDSQKRSEYDLEEELRTLSKQSNRGGTCRRSTDSNGYGRAADGYRSPSDRSYYRRNGRDHWRTYGHSYSRW